MVRASLLVVGSMMATTAKVVWWILIILVGFCHNKAAALWVAVPPPAVSISAMTVSQQPPMIISKRSTNFPQQLPPTTTTTTLWLSALSSSSSYSSTTKSLPQPQVPNFCANCGNPDMVLQIPLGDERPRAVCPKCGRIEYSNPKIVASCVVLVQEQGNGPRVLVGKRAIEPRRGTWGIPQGFMEHGETSREAAVREVWEETGVTLDAATLVLKAVCNVPGSVQLVYQATIDNDKPKAIATIQDEIKAYNARPHPEGGKESLQVALLSPKELAKKEICFPTVNWALEHCLQSDSNHVQQKTKFYNPETDQWGEFEDEALPAQ